MFLRSKSIEQVDEEESGFLSINRAMSLDRFLSYLALP